MCPLIRHPQTRRKVVNGTNKSSALRFGATIRSAFFLITKRYNKAPEGLNLGKV
jgi:hypothetical protein